MTVTLYRVGGSVRDELMGLRSKDVDYAVSVSGCGARTVEDGYAAMADWMRVNGFTVWLETPQYVTIRARFPVGQEHGGQTADFTLCRREGPYSDGRRPDWVELGTIDDDLARRDFTVNAIAVCEDGAIVDPHRGQDDLERGVLRCVGSATHRLTEDALRALRAVRFQVTRGLTWDAELATAMRSDWLPPLLSSISIERRREELRRAFMHDTIKTLAVLEHQVTPEFVRCALAGGIRLEPTIKE